MKEKFAAGSLAKIFKKTSVNQSCQWRNNLMKEETQLAVIMVIRMPTISWKLSPRNVVYGLVLKK